MKIIDGNTALRQCIPNTLATVAGEPSFFEKMLPYLEEAEQWLEDNITGEDVLDSISQEQDITPNRRMAAKIISCHALMNAVPSLDLVLTPNGFGIVNTGNIVPASKDRVDRLLASLEATRDNEIDNLLHHLPSIQGWLDTEQGRFFTATLFPNLSICRNLAIKEHLWTNYLELRSRLISIENKLAEQYFSQEQMADFRLKVARNNISYGQERHVILSIQSLEKLLVSNMDVHNQAFFDIVQIIREYPTLFPEWHASKTASLYSPTVFLNKKESTGYWF